MTPLRYIVLFIAILFEISGDLVQKRCDLLDNERDIQLAMARGRLSKPKHTDPGFTICEIPVFDHRLTDGEMKAVSNQMLNRPELEPGATYFVMMVASYPNGKYTEKTLIIRRK